MSQEMLNIHVCACAHLHGSSSCSHDKKMCTAKLFCKNIYIPVAFANYLLFLCMLEITPHDRAAKHAFILLLGAATNSTRMLLKQKVYLHTYCTVCAVHICWKNFLYSLIVQMPVLKTHNEKSLYKQTVHTYISE